MQVKVKVKVKVKMKINDEKRKIAGSCPEMARAKVVAYGQRRLLEEVFFGKCESARDKIGDPLWREGQGASSLLVLGYFFFCLSFFLSFFGRDRVSSRSEQVEQLGRRGNRLNDKCTSKRRRAGINQCKDVNGGGYDLGSTPEEAALLFSATAGSRTSERAREQPKQVPRVTGYLNGKQASGRAGKVGRKVGR
jgi:hypothetical protein